MKVLQQTPSQRRGFLRGQRSSQSAFTLTELLVTIDIIVVLGSILLTPLGRSKLKGYPV
jgi:prepilin-type N-terminal cleavage/methylation domain-containing protein